jgi:hypothetical protein
MEVARVSAPFDEEPVRAALRRSWSLASSTFWTPENPAAGQCGVSALVLNDRFGGEILKTPIGERWHFYNLIDGRRCDVTREQFDSPPDYLDLPSSREEALADTNDSQYAHLSRRFAAELAR